MAELFNELEVWGCAGEGVVAPAPGTQLAAYIGSQLPRGGCHKSAKHALHLTTRMTHTLIKRPL